MENVSVTDYSAPVRKVLLEPNVIMGIGIIPLVFILLLTIILMTTVSIWAGFVGVVLFIAAKMICKKDPLMLTIIFQRLMIPNCWRA